MTSTWFYMTDENGDPVDTILFEPTYQYNFTNSKLIYITSDLSDLENVTLTPAAVNPDLIPFTMQEASVNSDKYLELSEDNVSFSDEIEIALIERGVPYPVYVRCFIPDYAVEGNFVCGLNVEATYYA